MRRYEKAGSDPLSTYVGQFVILLNIILFSHVKLINVSINK